MISTHVFSDMSVGLNHEVNSTAFAGNIASWKKKEGEAVGAGDEMAEIETDKVFMCAL